jgi:hypothetical protein
LVYPYSIFTEESTDFGLLVDDSQVTNFREYNSYKGVGVYYIRKFNFNRTYLICQVQNINGYDIPDAAHFLIFLKMKEITGTL